jgi:hypothetical protein
MVTRTRWIAAGLLVALGSVLIAGALWSAGRSADRGDQHLDLEAVAAVSGFTKLSTTEHYVVVVNVLPAERMFTKAELATEHPTEGEVVLHGSAGPVLAFSRHVEAHIYDRATGLPVTGTTPSIVLTDGETGARTTIDPTLMEDVVIGASDVHFGNNVVVHSDRDITVTVDVAGEEVVISGHLD